MSKGGISAGQYAQAMRYLPMQITDVVTSLASGMPVWLVAIQQGGQIKDSFGGVGNTFKALLSIITPARLAMGGLAGIVAAAGIAAVSAMNDQDAFNSSIQKTGNYAGVTSANWSRWPSRVASYAAITVRFATFSTVWSAVVGLLAKR